MTKQPDMRKTVSIGFLCLFLAGGPPVNEVSAQSFPELVNDPKLWQPNALPESPAALFRQGKLYDKGEGVTQDKAKAVSLYRQAADGGYAEAQLLLGIMYDQGIGVPKDYDQALDWYRKAADQGYAKAQYNLAGMYDEGVGVPQDLRQAAGWYRKAAEQGYAKAQFNLGSMYLNAEGVEQDNARGYMWLKLAAGQGLEDKVKTRLDMASNLTPAEIKKGKKLVKEWQAKHKARTGK